MNCTLYISVTIILYQFISIPGTSRSRTYRRYRVRYKASCFKTVLMKTPCYKNRRNSMTRQEIARHRAFQKNIVVSADISVLEAFEAAGRIYFIYNINIYTYIETA